MKFERRVWQHYIFFGLMGTRSFQKPLRASLAIKIFHVIRDVIYPYVSLILSETLGTRQRSVVEYASVLLANLPQTLRNDPEKVQKCSVNQFCVLLLLLHTRYPWQIFKL